MTRSLVVAVVLAACSPDASPIPNDPTPWEGAGAYRRAIDIVPPPEFFRAFNVPIAVSIAVDKNHWRGSYEVISDAGLHVPAAGAELHDGKLELWVLMYLVDEPERLYLYYGDAGATESEDEATWENYAAVYHLSGEGSSPQETEWDASGRTGWLAAAPGVAEPTAGLAGGAREFDGVDDGLVTGAPGSLDFATQSFTYSLWVNENEAVDVDDIPLYKGGVGLTQPGYCMMLGSGAWVAQLHDGTTAYQASLGTEIRGEWTYLVAAVDRKSNVLMTYVNGVRTDTVDITGLTSLATTEPFEIGRSPDRPFRGAIDEVRVYAGTRGDRHIALEYANLANPSTVTVGPEQVRP